MTTEDVDDRNPVGLGALERSQLVARALSEAARRARFSTRSRRALASGGFHARRGQRLVRLLTIVSFIAIVVIPSLVGTVYFGLIASDQYVSESRFALRGGTPPKLDSLTALTGIPSIQIVQDTQIVINYLQSRALVETLQSNLDIKHMFSRPEVDYFSRLDPEKPIEKVVRYWNWMIEINLQLPSGIVVFSVRAFTPEDSAKIARAVLEASENLVNDMNDRMRKDAVALSDLEQQRAQDRLAQSRIALEQARNDEGVLSADKAADAQNDLISTERSNLLKMQQEYATQNQYVGESAPQLRALMRRIETEKEQIAQLEGQLTRRSTRPGDPRVLSGAMTRLDYLDFERQIAEKLYGSALTAYERARLMSESKLMYINTFVYPVEAQEARYPRRILIISLLLVGSVACWGLLLGLTVLVRNHMAR